MIKPDTNVVKQSVCLTAAGVALQIAGSLCLAAATLLMMKELSSKAKEILLEKLSD